MLQYNKDREIGKEEFEAADKLIGCIRYNYKDLGINKDDLQQAGWLGYLIGRKEFDENNGCPYIQWVILNISWEMCNLITKEFKHKRIKTTSYVEDVKSKHDVDEVLNRISIEQAIQVLTEQQKKFLEFRFRFGLTECQIAAKLGVSQGLISSLERQTLAILKAELQPPGEKRRDLIPTLKGGRLKNDD